MSDIVERLRHPRNDENRRKIMDEAADEIERLNNWADGFSDAQLKERRLCEELLRERQTEIERLRAEIEKLRLSVQVAADNEQLRAEVRRLIAENKRWREAEEGYDELHRGRR